MIDFIQLNKFSELHDGKNIFFCKIDFIEQDYELIRKLDNDVILITGNSDYPINEDIVKNLPKNVKKWYGQNVLINHEKIEPIPMGIENKTESIRYGHGIGYYDRVTEKENLLNRGLIVTPSKGIYANFRVETNYYHRSKVINICKNSSHIDVDDPNLNLTDFFTKILDYHMVVCPAGNGVDTHRIWEVLYSKRIPITIKIGNYKIYELYEILPIIILENESDLYNIDLIYEKYNNIIQNEYDMNLLNYSYWSSKITN